MSEVHGNPMQFRRLVVALAGRPREEAALLLAARLARRTGAQLHGLFLEDIDILEAVASPVRTMLVVHTSERRALDLVSVERGYRAHARRLRRLVASICERNLVRWSFDVRRARGEDFARHLEADDLLIVTPQGRSERQERLGNVLAGETAGAILLLEPVHSPAHRHVAILHEGGEDTIAAGAILAAALEAAASIIPVATGQSAPPTETIPETIGKGLSVPPGITAPVSAEPAQIGAVLDALRPDIVVIGRGGALSRLDRETLAGLLGPRAVLVAGRRQAPAEGQ